MYAIRSYYARAVVVTMPIVVAEDFKGTIDLVHMKARLYSFDQKGTYQETEIPAEYMEEATRLRSLLLEAVADADDSLMEKYLEGEELTTEDILLGLREGTLTGVFTPVFCGSALANRNNFV